MLAPTCPRTHPAASPAPSPITSSSHCHQLSADLESLFFQLAGNPPSQIKPNPELRNRASLTSWPHRLLGDSQQTSPLEVAFTFSRQDSTFASPYDAITCFSPAALGASVFTAWILYCCAGFSPVQAKGLSWLGRPAD